MKRWVRSGMVTLCLAGGATVAAQGTGSMATSDRPSMGNSGTPAPAGVTLNAADLRAAVELPKDEKGFLERLHQGNQREIRLGTLAQQKASQPSVRSFGKMMVTEHQQADERLLSYAKEKKMNLGEPKPLGERERKMIEGNKAQDAALQSAQGVMFDQLYMAGMVAAHDKTLDKLAAAQERFSTGEVSRLLAELAPRVSVHRDEAYRLLGELKPSLMPMGTGGAGTDDTGSTRERPMAPHAPQVPSSGETGGPATTP